MIDFQIVALGREGGWDPRDHDCFLRFWTQLFDTNESFEQQIADEERNKYGETDQPDNLSDLGKDDEDGDAGNEKEKASGEVYPALDKELIIPMSRRSAMAKKLATALPWKTMEEFDEHINW